MRGKGGKKGRDRTNLPKIDAVGQCVEDGFVIGSKNLSHGGGRRKKNDNGVEACVGDGAGGFIEFGENGTGYVGSDLRGGNVFIKLSVNC